MAGLISPKYKPIARLFTSLVLYGTAILSMGCASRLLAVGDWAQSPDLRLDNKSLQTTKVEFGCYRLNPDGTLAIRSYKVCTGLAADLDAYGATIVGDLDPNDPPLRPDYTIQYVDLQREKSDASFWSFAASSLTAWIVPVVVTTRSSAEFRILDHRGILVDRVPMTIAEVEVWGWTALVGFFEKSENQQKEFISRQVYAAARNRLASRLRATRWAKP